MKSCCQVQILLGFVFSIDHILESILTKCDRQTLLSCRLVSRRWAVYGSKELQKTVIIKFFTKVIYFERRNSLILRTARHISDSGDTGSMEELITLMNSSAEFPSNSFDFRSDERQGPSINMEIAQAFFNVHGSSIKKILFRQDKYVEDLKQLLLNQAPNLHQLCLDRINVKYKNSSKTEEQQPQQEQARRREFLFVESRLNPKPILKNLKVFKCHVLSVLPDIFIQQILECSPNLVVVALPIDQLHLFIQPSIRLPLLKKLVIQIHSLSNIDSYEILASLAHENTNLWAVRELYCFNVQEHWVADKEAFSARVTNVVGNILKACSATCQKLVWGMLVYNLKMPQMQQLRHLTLEYYWDYWGSHPVIHCLRGGLSLGDTFPNLKSLEVRTNSDMEDLPIANIFGVEDPSSASNVKTVTLRIGRPPGEMLLQSFRNMFPNAHIRSYISYNEEGYEVEIEDGGSCD